MIPKVLAAIWNMKAALSRSIAPAECCLETENNEENLV